MNPRLLLVTGSLILSLLIGVVISKRGPGAAPGGTTVAPTSKVRIGLSLDTTKEERWQRDRDRFVAKANELGAEVFVQSANSDDTRQMQDVQALISRGVDVMVIVPHNGEAMAKGADAALKAGMPVLSYDRLIRNSDITLYISFDNFRVGELQAQYLVDQLKGKKAKIVRIYGSKTDNNALLFKAGQDHVLQPLIDTGTITVVFEDWALDWKPENAKKIVNAAITAKGREIDAILASNDGTAGGAIQALTEEGLAGKVLVTGQDAELAACQRIQRGTQAMTIYKPLSRLADHAAEVAVALARRQIVIANGEVDNGFKKVPSILENVIVVDRSNMMDTIVKDGFHKAEDLK
ncbi:MAG TPA: substrate-binding domain-containing protein [Verrucomicrobiota bacterium]|nr:D-xylose transporter subunit XylF [Verrucomicrobiales bacterium]HRI13111.1 substrate-binding domain-containing protein [Verrucomicrobiota bacterium]